MVGLHLRQLMEESFIEGKIFGLATEWHENGQKKAEVIWKDGERDGLCTYWHENGMKSQEDTWKYGVVVSIRKWDKEGNEL